MTTAEEKPVSPPVIPIAGRSCEGCAMCCKLGAIAEVNKPDGQWCTHCTTRQSCDIYDTRPKVCRTYYCYYMLSELPEEWRPTTSKLMVSLMVGNLIYISVDPSRPDAWKKEPYFSMIRHWSSQARVVILVGLHATAIYPDNIVELGLVDDDHLLAEYNENTVNGVVKRTIRLNKKDIPADKLAQMYTPSNAS